jgi:hypothetical protein
MHVGIVVIEWGYYSDSQRFDPHSRQKTISRRYEWIIRERETEVVFRSDIYKCAKSQKSCAAYSNEHHCGL